MTIGAVNRLRAAQQITFSFLKVDPDMSLYAAVALLMVYQSLTGNPKIPIQTSDLSQELQLSPSTMTRLMSHLGQGRTAVGFQDLDFVNLNIDKKDRRRNSIAQHRFSGTYNHL